MGNQCKLILNEETNSTLVISEKDSYKEKKNSKTLI